MEIKIIYEMNPPKVLYDNHYDNDVIKKNVNINQAWTVLEGWRSSQRDLKALDVLKQRFKFKICACFDDLVKKRWLLSIAPGGCFIHT